jgi:hypothetical protein
MPLPAPVSGTNQIITPQLPAGAVGPFGVGLVPNGVAPLPLEAGRGSGEWGQAPTVIANPAPPPATDERRADEPRHVPVSAITDAALSPAERILADAYFVGDVPTAAAPVSVPPAVASPPPTSERKKPAARPSLAARVTRAVLGIATCLAGYQVLHDAAANRRSKRPRLAQESVPPLAPPVSLSPETPHSGTKGKV